jgi:preprotein translocase subunit SecA
MDELKNLFSEKLKENEELMKSTSITQFLLKNHEDVFNHIDEYAEEMATTTIKRFLMLTSESDGIKLIIQLCGDNVYNHPEFKMFIKKINQYFDKIHAHPKYEQNVDYISRENEVYDEFKTLLNRTKD